MRTIDSRATRMLAFATGDYDITSSSDVPLMKDVKARSPNAICEMTATNTQINLLVNRVNPPFDNWISERPCRSRSTARRSTPF